MFFFTARQLLKNNRAVQLIDIGPAYRSLPDKWAFAPLAFLEKNPTDSMNNVDMLSNMAILRLRIQKQVKLFGNEALTKPPLSLLPD